MTAAVSGFGYGFFRRVVLPVDGFSGGWFFQWMVAKSNS